jgi:hypothetical protein
MRLRWSRKYKWEAIWHDERGLASAVSGHWTPWGAWWAGWRNERARRAAKP